MKIRPLQDQIIVKRLEGEEKTKGGIIIPDSAQEKPMEGKVIAVGKGKLNTTCVQAGKAFATSVVAAPGKDGRWSIQQRSRMPDVVPDSPRPTAARISNPRPRTPTAASGVAFANEQRVTGTVFDVPNAD